MDKLMPPRPDRNSISPEHLEYYQNLGKVKWGKLQNGLFSPKGNFTKKLIFMKN